MKTHQTNKKETLELKGSTPLMHQYREIKSRYPNTLILFRMGDFYETFEEDAKVASKILGIALTRRANGAAAEVPLAGFPYHSLDSYLYKLVNSGLKVAICEQVEDPKLAKGLVKREVVEIITPGTTISEEIIERKKPHFLGAVYFQNDRCGFAVLDHSTGQFHIGESSPKELVQHLMKFSPKEVIVPDNLDIENEEWVKKIRPFVSRMDEWIFDYQTCLKTLLDHFRVASLKGFGCQQMTLGISSAGVILKYVEHNTPGGLRHITRLIPVETEGVMSLDDFTVRNLEIFQSLSTQGTHGTLIGILDKTITAGGGRLLNWRLKHPLTDRKKIEERLSQVEGFVENQDIRREVRMKLTHCGDLERILGKLSRQKATPRDLINLKLTCELVPILINLLAGSKNDDLLKLSHAFEETETVAGMITSTLVDDPPLTVSEGGVIRMGVNADLDELRQISKGGKNWIVSLEKTERERTGISSLKIGYNRVFGYYLEITKVHQNKVPQDYIRKQTLANSERYVTPELKEYEEKILNAEERIVQIEIQIYRDLCSKLLEQSEKIQRTAEIISQIDLYSALADLADEKRYVRPEFGDIPTIRLKDSRHPVVEAILPAGEKFVPNDLELSSDLQDPSNKAQILLITGPNMAGKSTYLRQIGQIVVMAQMGSFVPATQATLGVVDKLFTRVGASDNLAGGESTFLVEMLEASNILNNATDRSLVLFDEIGRGTATYDGLSLAWAITEFLHNTSGKKAKTVFATHYHELTVLENLLERVKNYNVAVKEFGDKIIFLRKIVPGPSDKSYGIHVAQMAGLPKPVVLRAQEILNHLVKHQSPDLSSSAGLGGTPQSFDAFEQLNLFSEQELKLRKALSELDINQMTPVQALQKLNELKSEFGL